MGRLLNPKKRKTISRKLHKDLQEQGVDVNYERSDHIANPCAESVQPIQDTILQVETAPTTAMNYQKLSFEKEINNLLNKYPLFNNEPVDAEFIEDDSPIGIEFPEWLSKSIKTGKVEAKTIQNECSPGICYDIWRDGDW